MFGVTNTMTVTRVVTSRINVNNIGLLSERTTRANSSPTRTVPNRKGQVVIVLKPGLTHFIITSSRCSHLNKGIKTTCSSTRSKNLIIRHSFTSVLFRLCDDVCRIDTVKIYTTCGNTKGNGTVTVISNAQTSCINSNVVSNCSIDDVINSSSSCNGVVIVCPGFTRSNNVTTLNTI